MRRRFTQTEVYYLNTLPAVERASMDRITYSKEFQVRCMAQYLRGNGPTSIFASAGLDPKIMGGKRIERAIAGDHPSHDHQMAGKESHGPAETASPA